MNPISEFAPHAPRRSGRAHLPVVCRLVDTVPSRNAFTLIELLVVITVIGLLMAMLLVVISGIRTRAKVLQTQQRIENCLQTFTRLGGEGERITAAFVLQRDCQLGGTLLFRRLEVPGEQPTMIPINGLANWHKTYPDLQAVAPGNALIAASGAGKPLIMAYPWGRGRKYQIREPWYSSPLSLPDPRPGGIAQTLSTPQQALWDQPEEHRLAELWPERSEDLLVRSGVGTRRDIRNNRSSNMAWNDAYGNPLVVSYALYQPPRCDRSERDTANDHLGGWVRGGLTFPADTYLRSADQAYGYTRSLFISVASVGPTLDPAHFPGGGLPDPSATDAEWTAAWRGCWQQVCAVTMPTPAEAWTEASFVAPPWQGVRQVKVMVGGKVVRCQISAPIELR